MKFRNQQDAGTMLRQEILNMINRWGKESDITCFQVIGALEMVKRDVLDHCEENGGSNETRKE